MTASEDLGYVVEIDTRLVAALGKHSCCTSAAYSDGKENHTLLLVLDQNFRGVFLESEVF